MQQFGVVSQSIKNGLTGLLLGNLYHGSLLNGLRSFGQGNVITGATEVVKAVTNVDGHKNAVKNALGTFKSATVDKVNKPKKNNKTSNLGNINKSKSIINNI